MEKQLTISFIKVDLGYRWKNLWFTRIHISDGLQMWSPRSPWMLQPAEFLSPEKKGGKVKEVQGGSQIMG